MGLASARPFFLDDRLTTRYLCARYFVTDRKRMKRTRLAALALIISILPLHTASAQKALVIFLHGAHYTPLGNLSDAGDDIASRFGLGGGLGIQLSPGVALRATGTFINTEYRGKTLTIADSSLSRSYVFGELQTGWPGTSSFVLMNVPVARRAMQTIRHSGRSCPPPGAASPTAI